MLYFFDTSALLKRYIPEEGTARVDNLFLEKPVHISNLSITESICVFRRLLDVKRIISEKEFILLKERIFADIADGSLEVAELTAKDIITGFDLLNSCYITPLDSLILASAINMKQYNTKISFICADEKLCKLANQFMKIINPLEEN